MKFLNNLDQYYKTMQCESSLLLDVALKLELEYEYQDAVYGWYEGFPIAISTLGENGEIGLLIQIRHHIPKDSLPDENNYEWDEELSGRINTGDVKAEVDDKIAWLTLYNSEAQISPDILSECIDQFLAGIVSAGIESIDTTCHYCLSETVDNLTYDNGRVGQICDSCLAERRGIQDDEKEARLSGIAGSAVLGLVASFVGAVIWSVSWIAYYYILEMIARGHEKILIPYIVSLIVTIVIGGASGCVVGYAVKLIPKRGYKIASMVGCCCGFVAAVLGELIVVGWLVISETKMMSLDLMIAGLSFLWSFDPMETVFRALAVVVCIGVSYYFATPHISSLNL